MKRALTAAAIVLLLAACSDATEPPQPQLDQENLLDGTTGGQGIGRFDQTDGAPDPDGTSFDYQDAQTFTVGITGRLVLITLPVLNTQSPAATLGVTLEITRVTQGAPDESQSLGEVTLPAAAFPTDFEARLDPAAWAAFDVSDLQIDVVAGEELALLVRTASPIGYLYNPEITLGYADGAGYRRNAAVTSDWSPAADFGFRTFVLPE